MQAIRRKMMMHIKHFFMTKACELKQCRNVKKDRNASELFIVHTQPVKVVLKIIYMNTN